MLVLSDKIVFLFTSVMTQALRVITAFVMARLLTPNDYGLLTLISIAPSFIAALGDCGIARALVQYRDLPTETVEASGLTVSVALSLFYATLWLASGFYFRVARHDPRLLWIGIIGAVTIVLAAIYTFQMACLNRDLKFRDESRQNIIFAAALAVTGLSMALWAHHHRQWGVFALALQPLVAQIMGNLVIFHRHPFRWPRAFSIGMAKKLLNYGWKVTLAQYANNLQQSLVSLFVIIVGGTWGAGIFGRATQVSDMIGYNLLSTFDRLLHPLLRSVREDKERLRGIFVRGCIGAVLLCGFGWAWLVGTAPDLIRVVMGPQWDAVPPLLRIIATVLLANCLGMMGIIVTHALGKPLIWLCFGVANLLMLFIAIKSALFYHRSLAAIATAYILCQGTYSISLWIWAMRTLKIAPFGLLGHVARLIGAACATCACILLVRDWMQGGQPLLRLIASSGVGAAVFLGSTLLVDRDAILDFRTLVRRRGTPEPPAPQTAEPTVWQADGAANQNAMFKQ
ncbi:MAG TPA: oligosaccharide flippase family protein [Tepidisphaeraceae bacterium]|nr:oligosaccharide flippase family protein [Tepidisphaeraceae bacterium]